MSTIDVKAALEAIRPEMERAQAEGKLDGITFEDLESVSQHPQAGPVLAEMMEVEGGAVQQAAPAADFALPRLSSGADDERRTVTLSEHFGQQPVALIFGSYT